MADFSTTLSPTTMTMPVNSSAGPSVSVTPESGFSGTVHLSSSVTPSNGLGASLASASVNAGPGLGSTTLNLSATVPGAYTVTVTATAGALSHQTTLKVTVTGPDFVLKGPKKGKIVKAGRTTSVKVTVKALAGFTGAVTFKLTGLPSGATHTLKTPQVNGKGSETFTIVTTTTEPIGVPFTLTFTATSGAIVRTFVSTLTLK